MFKVKINEKLVYAYLFRLHVEIPENMSGIYFKIFWICGEIEGDINETKVAIN